MRTKAEQLREIVAVMRELYVIEAYGITLGPLPTPKLEPVRLTMEQQEEAEDLRKRARARTLLGGDPSEELYEKLKRVL